MFCMSCGANVPEGARFCPFCGVPAGAWGEAPVSPMGCHDECTTVVRHSRTAAAEPCVPSRAGGAAPGSSNRRRRRVRVGVIAAVIGGVMVLAIAGIAVWLLVGGSGLLGGEERAEAPEVGETSVEPKSEGDVPIITGNDLSGTLFDLSLYEQSLADVEKALQDEGLEFEDSWGYRSGSAYQQVSLTYGGTVAPTGPISMRGEDFSVSVVVDPGSSEIAWDEQGYCDDQVRSLSELADDARLIGLDISFSTDIDSTGFAEASLGIRDALGLSGMRWVIASSPRLLEETFSLLATDYTVELDESYSNDTVIFGSEPFVLAGSSVSCTVNLREGYGTVGDELSRVTIAISPDSQ